MQISKRLFNLETKSFSLTSIGEKAKNYIRINYVNTSKNIKKTINRISDI